MRKRISHVSIGEFKLYSNEFKKWQSGDKGGDSVYHRLPFTIIDDILGK